ncbi:MAG: NAD(P)H-binding protein [Novosphingobium sp.]
MIAVTGATGFVGQSLLDRAAEAGVEVRALARQPQDKRKGVRWVAGDLADTKALAKLCKGTEAVVHVAGVVNAPDPAGFEEGNVAGTLNVVEAARKAGVRRFIFVSSLSAREPKMSAYGQSKARAEKVVKASGLDWVIVRPPAIYGPRDREMFELFRSAKWGIIPTPKDGKTSLIHVDDLSRLLLALLPGGERNSHRIFEPDDGKPGGWNHYELARAIGWAVGRRPLVLGLSRRTMEWAAKVDGRIRGKKAKLTLDRVGYFCHPDWVVSKGGRVPVSLWRPRVETREGLKATAQWYRAEGWL